MALEQEFQTAKKNGFAGNKLKFSKLSTINKLEWAEIYLENIIFNLDLDTSAEKTKEIRKLQQEIRKIAKKIDKLEV